MENRTAAIPNEDLDLRVYLKRVIPFWPFLLFLSLFSFILTIAINIILPPVYRATAIVTVPLYVSNGQSAVTLLQHENIYKAVLAKQGVGADILDRLTVTADKKDEVTYHISVEAPTASQAVLEANAWAEESIKWVKQRLLNLDRAWLNKTKSDLEDTDAELLQFLDSHGLNEYSILDLRYYEGMYSMEEYTPASLQEPLALNSSVREELRKLLRAQSNASAAYSDSRDRFNEDQLKLQTNSPIIVNHALPPEEPIRPQALPVIKDAAIALAVALMAGITIVLIWTWWKNPSDRPKT